MGVHFDAVTRVGSKEDRNYFPVVLHAKHTRASGLNATSHTEGGPTLILDGFCAPTAELSIMQLFRNVFASCGKTLKSSSTNLSLSLIESAKNHREGETNGFDQSRNCNWVMSSRQNLSFQTFSSLFSLLRVELSSNQAQHHVLDVCDMFLVGGEGGNSGNNGQNIKLLMGSNTRRPKTKKKHTPELEIRLKKPRCKGCHNLINPELLLSMARMEESVMAA
ncbi:hypothetical protein BDN72DRAFT_866076, partial [Pluteus cervinus]